MTADFAREPQLIRLFHDLKLILLCGTWRLLEKQKQPIAATALILPTDLINANGLLINYLLLTTTKQPILSQFAKHGILTDAQVAHSPVMLITTFAGTAVLIPK